MKPGGFPAAGIPTGPLIAHPPVKSLLLTLLLLPADTGAQDSTIADNDALLWAANTGWILPRHSCPAPNSGLRCTDGCLGGFVWSANCGWINFGDGTPANGLRYANTDGSDSGVNLDAAGFTDADEFLADTDPLSAAEHFDVLATWQTRQFGLELQHLRWSARPSRHYRILASPDLAPGSWQPTGSALFSSAQGLPITGSAPIPGGAARRFFRVEVIRPLAP